MSLQDSYLQIKDFECLPQEKNKKVMTFLSSEDYIFI